MQTSNEIIIDIIESSQTHYTLQQLNTEFANEIFLYDTYQLSEEELYEIISTAVDRNNIIL